MNNVESGPSGAALHHHAKVNGLDNDDDDERRRTELESELGRTRDGGQRCSRRSVPAWVRS